MLVMVSWSLIPVPVVLIVPRALVSPMIVILVPLLVSSFLRVVVIS